MILEVLNLHHFYSVVATGADSVGGIAGAGLSGTEIVSEVDSMTAGVSTTGTASGLGDTDGVASGVASGNGDTDGVASGVDSGAGLTTTGVELAANPRRAGRFYYPNIAEFIGYVIAGKVLKNVRSLMIIMDYYNCSNLYFPLQIISRYTESNTRYYMRQLCNALAYLHSANIVHGDLKLENLVINVYELSISPFKTKS